MIKFSLVLLLMMSAFIGQKNSFVIVLVPGQPEYETIAIGDHSFKLKNLDGYSLKFEVSEKIEPRS